MWYNQISRTEALKGFRAVYFVDAATVGDVFCYDVGTFDGTRVITPATANLALPAGAAVAIQAAASVGTIQTFGYNDTIGVDGTTDVAAGDPLAVANGSLTLAKATAVTNAAGTYIPAFTAGEAYTTNSVADKKVFIRCV